MTISVIIPTFNRRDRIRRAVDSVLAQSEVDVDVVVVDDQSTDGTAEWLAMTYAGRPVTVIPNTRTRGPAGARNTGILAAAGKAVALLDSDDEFLPGHLAECQRVLERFPGVDVIFGRALYEQDGRAVAYMGPNFDRKLADAPIAGSDANVLVFGDDFFTHLLTSGCFFNLSTVVLRAAAARELMREELQIAEDFEFWCRLSRKHGFACLLEPQIRYALHEANISFEAEATAAGNAPQQLIAYQVIASYAGLGPGHMSLLRDRMAELLFDWAYRCRMRGDYYDAARLHVQSLRLGRRRANALALLKLAAAAGLGCTGSARM